ncbi:MAG: hypothetical protein AAGC91_04835 [Pseudomonadota bacterium]
MNRAREHLNKPRVPLRGLQPVFDRNPVGRMAYRKTQSTTLAGWLAGWLANAKPNTEPDLPG